MQYSRCDNDDTWNNSNNNDRYCHENIRAIVTLSIHTHESVDSIHK